MLITYIIVSTLIGIFMSYIWSSKGFANTMIKMVFSAYTIWSAILLASILVPMMVASGMRMF